MPWSKATGWSRGAWNAGAPSGSPNTAVPVGFTAWQSTGSSAQDVDLSAVGGGPVANDIVVVIQPYGNNLFAVPQGLGSATNFTLLGSQSTFRWDEGSSNASSNKVRIYWKVWSANDVSGGGTPANAQKLRFGAGSDTFAGALILIYRGGTTVSMPNLPSYGTPSTGPMTVAGLTPDPLSYGVILAFITRKTSPGVDIAGANLLAGWTNRVNQNLTYTSGSMASDDRLNGYSGGNVAQTFGATLSNLATMGIMLEIK
jgi:hypothetical protein